MTNDTMTLAELGWNTYFSSQLSGDDLTIAAPVRVMEVQRNALHLCGEGVDQTTPPFRAAEDDDESAATVGDWLLLDRDTGRPARLLDRKSVFKRRAPGTNRRLQLIAANVDTLFIVSSCNQDFNLARLERYLALARETGVTPIIVLTKADLAEAPQDFVAEASARLQGVMVETVNALDGDSVAGLDVWIGRGQTVALVGSSGVGKSTLINSLAAGADVRTQGIREDDHKGRHTTTARQLYRLSNGGWLIDTPGMRELQLTDVRAGLDAVFSDIADTAAQCRFSDCQHESEPGCAVQAAIRAGEIDPARLANFQKLAREEARNAESLAERHQRDRKFGKIIKAALKEKNKQQKN